MSSFIDSVCSTINPSYEKQTEQSKVGTQARLAAIIEAVGAVALAAIGIACLPSGLGVVFLVSSLALAYSAYNTYRVGENLEKLGGEILSPFMSKEKLKERLAENTIGYSWAVNFMVDNFLK